MIRPERIRELLDRFRRGDLSADDILERLLIEPVEDLEFARLDLHRTIRLGYPEVIFCPGKTVEQISEICSRLASRGEGFLATRAEPAVRERLRSEHPAVEVNDLARTVHLPPSSPVDVEVRGDILVVTAGTADLPVAEEAAVAARALGNPVIRLNDVGVAGIHRILSARQELEGAAVVIVVAGMEAALASVVGGLVSVPIIAVPTSVGYGAAFGGLAALLGTLNSCAPGVVVVNIDNGYGAAAAATRINRLS